MSRRELDLPDLQGVLQEAQRLHDEGYKRQGEWGLAQVCRHLTHTINESIESHPTPSGVGGKGLAALLHPRLSFQLFSTRRINDGVRASDEALPPDQLDDTQELLQLRAAIQRFENHPGPFQPHPTLGPLTREQWLNLHVIHASHHLSFLHPMAELATVRH